MIKVNRQNHEEVAGSLTREQCLAYLAEKGTDILRMIVSDDLYDSTELGEFEFYPENLGK